MTDSPKRPSDSIPTPRRLPIHAIQGSGLLSPWTEHEVVTQGVVTGSTRKGFFIQDPRGEGSPSGQSDGVFVYSRRERPPVGASVEVRGRVVDYVSDDYDHPTTQIVLHDLQPLGSAGSVEPIWLTVAALPRTPAGLAEYLNRLEGMLVGVEAGATFIAPSNPFGDYVVLPKGDDEAVRTRDGGVLIDPENPLRWFPGFRILDPRVAPVVNVGAVLESDVVGPLNYRSAAYQIAAEGPIEVSNPTILPSVTSFESSSERLTILTLNGFNLDAQVEDPRLVADPGRDVDDDVGAGRFRSLARAIVGQARSPDLIALQEIQDSDGAELSEVVAATATYRTLIEAVLDAGGPHYEAVDIAPQNNADGGQPGGNIRNGFLFDPIRVELVEGSLRRLGEAELAFVESRKVLEGTFRKRTGGLEITVLNVHLASKRHQRGVFSSELPGFDPREVLRTDQARFVRQRLLELKSEGRRYYVTGDFNDFEFSETLRALLGDESVNLASLLPAKERYDYNHRGRSQVLMHGIVARWEAESEFAHYEILHGNELLGIQPGDLGAKPTDHGYVLAAFDRTP
ncbi:MAG: hypothetical protein K8J08_18530 [Thermoanaerobaculia bacterium]|nr:hypothetical protein [Thermoanaerobaculia bacterium]